MVLASKGFYRKEDSSYSCQDGFDVSDGDNETGYEAIQGAFSDCRKGSYARAILLSPLHPYLPKTAVCLHPTCNRFDHTFVLQQWQKLDQLYERYLEPVLGPMIGASSDRDARQCTLMLEMALCTEGKKVLPCPTRGRFYLLHQ